MEWYQSYNAAKHDRHNAFEKASFKNTLDSLCGLSVLISSQFLTNNFSKNTKGLGLNSPGDGFEDTTGGYFRIQYPTNWLESERYDFNWEELNKTSTPIQKFTYPPYIKK